MKDYEKCITDVAAAILREYHELFGKQLPDQGGVDHGTLEEQRRQLNYELNTSGKYFAYKEQLKVKTPLCFLLPCLFCPDIFSGRNCFPVVVTQDDVVLQNPFLPPGAVAVGTEETGFPSKGAGTELLWSHTKRTLPFNGS